ncbi:hypothetical protein AB9R16_01335 [Neisseria gonorrhoeae]
MVWILPRERLPSEWVIEDVPTLNTILLYFIVSVLVGLSCLVAALYRRICPVLSQLSTITPHLQ